MCKMSMNRTMSLSVQKSSRCPPFCSREKGDFIFPQFSLGTITYNIARCIGEEDRIIRGESDGEIES